MPLCSRPSTDLARLLGYALFGIRVDVKYRPWNTTHYNCGSQYTLRVDQSVFGTT